MLDSVDYESWENAKDCEDLEDSLITAGVIYANYLHIEKALWFGVRFVTDCTLNDIGYTDPKFAQEIWDDAGKLYIQLKHEMLFAQRMFITLFENNREKPDSVSIDPPQIFEKDDRTYICWFEAYANEKSWNGAGYKDFRVDITERLIECRKDYRFSSWYEQIKNTLDPNGNLY